MATFYNNADGKFWFFVSMFLLVLFVASLGALSNKNKAFDNQKADAFYSDGFNSCLDAVSIVVNETTQMFDDFTQTLSKSDACISELKLLGQNDTFVFTFLDRREKVFEQLEVIEENAR